ncbi:hypothetical protein B0T21DRAFT_411606 [Apiosordaria backusii]|uniref:Uncharacterized protein n=1 Tax=Apiosordaria backusii TaxID=314023 RepID=A0AA40BLH9_9PEZI|nr:hypothetical protein B0T21DRAFT_411606 [Apiosordaria backusii]
MPTKQERLPVQSPVVDRKPTTLPTGPDDFAGLRNHWAIRMIFRSDDHPSPASSHSPTDSNDGWDLPYNGMASVSSATSNNNQSSEAKSLSARLPTRSSTKADKGDSPRPVIEHVVPSARRFCDPSQIHDWDGLDRKRTAESYKLNYGGDTARVFLKTAADFDKYATDMTKPRSLFHEPCRRDPDSDLELELHLQKVRESRIRRRMVARRSQDTELKKSVDLENFKQKEHHGSLPPTQAQQKERPTDVESSGDCAGDDSQPFTWWW